MGGQQSKPCIFCNITSKNEEGKILAENDEFVIFSDIRPAAEHHYLIVPKIHVGNVKTLKGQDGIELVKKLEEFGKEYLEGQGGNIKNTRIGFHWPPFCTVDHLHLHVISPSDSMAIIQSTIFKENSFYFVSTSYVINWITKQLDI